MKLQLAWLRACGACVALLFPALVLALGVAGPIDVDTTWSSLTEPYVIQGDVTVNATLTIAPGVQVQFAGPYTLKVAGTLSARGTAQNNIVFTAPGNVIVPAKLLFIGGDAVFANGVYQSGSILEHVVVQKIGSIDTLGAVVLFGAHPYISNSIIKNNGASGIYAYSISGDLRIEHNTIESNRAALGGGLYVSTLLGAKLLLNDNTVRNNTVSGGNGFGNGGGLHLTVDGSLATLNANKFENNQASGVAGGIYLAGVNSVMSANVIALAGGSIQGNHAALHGGGGYADKVAWAIDAATLRDNVAESGNGGGLFLQQSKVTITKSMLLRNRSLMAGGGMYLSGGTYEIKDSVLAMNSSDSAHGGGIDMHGLPNVTITRSVIAGNKARDYGAAVSITDGICAVTNSALVLNESANAVGVYVEANLQNNTIAYNSVEAQSQLLGGTLGIGKDASQKLAINNNNIFNNLTPYDIVSFDNGTVANAAVVNARSNWWGDAVIASRLKIGDGVLFAAIDASLPSASPNLDAPISPPSGVSSRPLGASLIELRWQANPESDTQGYKVYWGTKPAPDFDSVNVMDVGKKTKVEIPVPAGGFVAVTAYDTGYAASIDDAATPVNENQTLGHESWYALSSSTIAMKATPAKHLKKGDLVALAITVTNTGPSVGSGEFIVTHTIAPGLSYYYASPSATSPELPLGCQLSSPTNDRQVTCTHAKLDPGSPPAEITIHVVVTTPDTSEVVSTASVRPNINDPNVPYNEAQVSLHVNAPDVAVSWTSNPPEVKVGASVEYQVTVKNNGQVPAAGTVLDIIVPASITFNASPNWLCSPPDANGNTTCSYRIDMLAGKAQVSVTFGLTGTAAGDVALVAQVATAGDSDAANNQARATITVTSAVKGGGIDGGVNPPANKKKGGGVVDLMGLLLLSLLLALRRRCAVFATA